MSTTTLEHTAAWPRLSLDEWRLTGATLHLWSQIVGKIRLRQAPMVNHWWNVTLYVTARGLTTSPMPYGDETFEILFDFADHELRIETSRGETRRMRLASRPVADFYGEVLAMLRGLELPLEINPMPQEIDDPTRLDRDRRHGTYDPEQARRFWQMLAQSDRVLQRFRSRWEGKSSPVHFFWGGFDMAVTRFSGRRAPEHPSVPHLADFVVREAYSHEVSSCGLWPGGVSAAEPAYYAYAYPEPAGFADYPVRPAEARYDRNLREFLLPYEAVRGSSDPDAMLLDFCQSTYLAAAELAHWDRAALERPAGDS